MTISSVTRGGAAQSASRKAAIMRQIRKLEKKRDELLEKLSGDSGGKSAPATSAPGTVTMQQKSQTPGENGSADADALSVDNQARSLSQAMQNLRSSLSSGAETPEPPEDPKEILKKIQMIEMQIMVLRQQLDEDDMGAVDAERQNEKNQENAAALFEQAAETIVGNQMAALQGVGEQVDAYA